MNETTNAANNYSDPMVIKYYIWWKLLYDATSSQDVETYT